jgi:hypothetical protein
MGIIHGIGQEVQEAHDNIEIGFLEAAREGDRTPLVHGRGAGFLRNELDNDIAPGSNVLAAGARIPIKPALEDPS